MKSFTRMSESVILLGANQLKGNNFQHMSITFQLLEQYKEDYKNFIEHMIAGNET